MDVAPGVQLLIAHVLEDRVVGAVVIVVFVIGEDADLDVPDEYVGVAIDGVFWGATDVYDEESGLLVDVKDSSSVGLLIGADEDDSGFVELFHSASLLHVSRHFK